MARATWLLDVLRGAGLTVHEYSGWRTRGYDGFNPVAVVAHATAGATNSTDSGEMRTLWQTGSASAPAPISQLYLSRSGEWWVGATGTCNHIGNAPLPGTGQSGNDNAIGIEAQHGRDEPWTAKQYDSYVKGVAAILKHQGWGVARVFGHKEISSSGKTDPYFNMNTFRERVKAEMEGEDMPLTETDANTLLHKGGMLIDKGETGQQSVSLAHALQILKEQSDATLKATAGQSGEGIIAEIRAQGEATRAALADKLNEMAPQLARAVADQVDHDLDTEAVEAALRSVFGSVDNPA